MHSCVLAPTRFVRTVFLHVLMNFYGILTFPFFFPHSPFCGATQAHLYCTCAAKHQHMQYHQAVRPALPGINAADDRRDTLLLPCLSHVLHTFSLSSARCHTSKVILHRTTKVILLFSFYFPSPPLMFNVYPCFVLLFLLFLLSRVLAVRFVSVR